MAQSVHKINYVDGGKYDFILHGETDSGRKIEFWVPAEKIMEMAKTLEQAGAPGHAMWHLHNNFPVGITCSMCYPYGLPESEKPIYDAKHRSAEVKEEVGS